MLSIPHQAIGFSFISDLSLPTLKGIGLQYTDSHTYFWNNEKRNDSHCMVQYCIDGEGTLEFDGISYPVRQGDAFVISIPGSSCYYLPEHSSHWEFIYLEFTKESLPMLLKIHRAVGPVIHFSDHSLFLNRALEIYQMALDNSIKSCFQNAEIACTFWLRLTEYALTLSVEELSKADLAKSFMDQYYFRNDLNLDLIADHIGLSKYSLLREFQKKYGITPGKYLRGLRIAQACRLLMTDSDYTLQDIAEMVGYSNNNYFGKVFKAEKGISPDKYRKQSAKYDLVRAVYETPYL